MATKARPQRDTAPITKTFTREYGYTLGIRSSVDVRAHADLTTIHGRAHPTETERNRQAAVYITDLEVRQGYRVERLENWSRCVACFGTGTQRVKPKGWRKRTEPPWFMLKTVACRTCDGAGEQTTDERIDR